MSTRTLIPILLLVGPGCPSEAPPPVDLPPSAPEVVFFPAEPAASDEIEAVILAPAVDPEGEEVTYRYRWSLDGVPAAFLDDQESVWPGDTASGQRWEVSVSGVDPAGNVGPAGTNSAVVRGSPPAIRGALLGPIGATIEDTLVVEPVDWTDSDGDPPRFTYEWWVSGRRLEDATSESLDPSFLTEGASVFVVLTPFDDEFTGVGVDSNTVVVRPLDPCVGLTLDGDDRVDFEGEALPALSDLALEAWVRADGPGIVASTRAESGGWELAVAPSGHATFWIGGAEVVSSAVVTDGAWHHLAGTRNSADAGRAVLWVDGAPDGVEVSDPPGVGGALRAGDGFSGGIDDLRISSVPRYRDAFTPDRYWAADGTTVGVWLWSEGEGTSTVDGVGARPAILDGPIWGPGVCAD